MKTVYLIRHAKSSWSNPDLKDFERPLNSRGERDAKMMAKQLKEKVKSFDLVLSSTAVRAKETSGILFSDKHLHADDIQFEKDLYHASAKKIRKFIAETSDDLKNLVIVAHNPGLTELANEFSNVKIDNIPTTGILAIEFDIKKWEKILKEEGSLLFFDYPKKYKAVK